MDRLDERALGKEHMDEYGAGLGQVTKDLDAAAPLSLQGHDNVEEAYWVEHMGKGTGLFLGINEAGSREHRLDMIDNVIFMIENESPLVIRLKEPREGVETPEGFSDGFPAFKSRILNHIRTHKNTISIAELVEYLLLEGINVVDVAGFGIRHDGGKTDMDGNLSLLQWINPNHGERFVTRMLKMHALFGNINYFGPSSVSWFMEFKGTSTGPRYETVASAEQTWALNDNLLGKEPRKGKVTRERVKEFIDKAKEQGYWRKFTEDDYRPSTDGKYQDVSPGVRWTRVHEESQFSATRIIMQTGGTTGLKRFGRHSALVVRSGRVLVKNLEGRVIAELGFDGKGWDGKNSNEGFILAEQGNLIIESIGSEEAIVYDGIRPVPGVPLPTPVPVESLARPSLPSSSSADAPGAVPPAGKDGKDGAAGQTLMSIVRGLQASEALIESSVDSDEPVTVRSVPAFSLLSFLNPTTWVVMTGQGTLAIVPSGLEVPIAMSAGGGFSIGAGVSDLVSSKISRMVALLRGAYLARQVMELLSTPVQSARDAVQAVIAVVANVLGAEERRPMNPQDLALASIAASTGVKTWPGKDLIETEGPSSLALRVTGKEKSEILAKNLADWVEAAVAARQTELTPTVLIHAGSAYRIEQDRFECPAYLQTIIMEVVRSLPENQNIVLVLDEEPARAQEIAGKLGIPKNRLAFIERDISRAHSRIVEQGMTEVKLIMSEGLWAGLDQNLRAVYAKIARILMPSLSEARDVAGIVSKHQVVQLSQ